MKYVVMATKIVGIRSEVLAVINPAMLFLGLRIWFAGEIFEAIKREFLGCFRHNTMDCFVRVSKTRMLIEIWTEKTWLGKVFSELAAILSTFWQIL